MRKARSNINALNVRALRVIARRYLMSWRFEWQNRRVTRVYYLTESINVVRYLHE